MRITPLAIAGTLAVAAFATPATAATKKPISKEYDVTAPAPDPTNYAGTATGQGYSVCNQTVPNSFDKHEFTAPWVGKIKVTLTGFTGDWDLLLMDKNGNELTNSGGSDIGSPATPQQESFTYKIKKAKTAVEIVACNWAGGPSGHVKYTFTPV